jgi:hypothetical protein
MEKSFRNNSRLTGRINVIKKSREIEWNGRVGRRAWSEGLTMVSYFANSLAGGNGLTLGEYKSSLFLL